MSLSSGGSLVSGACLEGVLRVDGVGDECAVSLLDTSRSD